MAGTLPTGDPQGNASRSHAYNIGSASNSLFPVGGTTDTETLNFNVSWEIDLFGRLAQERRAANADLAATRFDVEGARASLAANVADGLFQARGLAIQLEDAEANATEDELAAKRSAPSTMVSPFLRKRPARKPFPEHLPRERIVIATPATCPCCGWSKLSKLGEDVTETLEVVPRRWKVIQTVRERFSCRRCEAITQPPAPFHVTPRGFAGPSLLAMILFEKFG